MTDIDRILGWLEQYEATGAAWGSFSVVLDGRYHRFTWAQARALCGLSFQGPPGSFWSALREHIDRRQATGGGT